MRRIGVSLLDQDDEKRFEEPGRRYTRWVEVAPGSAIRGSKDGLRRAILETEIQSEILTAKRTNAKWSRAACIEVRRNDGMSWAAETVRRAVVHHYPGFDTFSIRNEASPDRLPVVAQMIGEPRLMQIAIRHQLADEYPTVRSWRSVMLGILTITILFAKQVTELIVRDVAQHPGPGMMGVLAQAILALAAAGVIGQWLVATRPVLSRRVSEQRFRASLPKIQDKHEYRGFVEALAAELARMAEPRFVIIDNYEVIDEVTQDVIQRYFAEHHANATQAEFWIVFEGEGGGDRLSSYAIESAREPGYLHPLMFRQEALSLAERRALAEKIGKPERATFSAVKSICRPGAGNDEFIERLFEPLKSKHEFPLTLPYFHLLAMEVPDLAAEHRDAAIGAIVHFSGGVIGVREEKESTTVSLTGVTAEEATIRATVLGAFFGKTLRKSDVSSVEREIRAKLAPLILQSGEEGMVSFAVTREAAIYCHEHWAKYELPHPAIAKLFWAFTLSQRRNVLRAFWARRVIHHLVEIDLSKLPAALKEGIVMTELRNTTLNMVDAALKCGLFGELPELIRFARLLIADYDSVPQASLKRLRKHSWQAYHLTGAEEILSELIQMHVPQDEGGESPALTSPLRLFSQSIAARPEVRGLLESYLLADNARLDFPEAHDYALARACWLTLLAVPFLSDSSRDPRGYGVFDSGEIRATVKAIGERATERLSAGGDDVSTLDVATLSLAVWCTALLLDVRNLECTGAPAAAGLLWTADAAIGRAVALAVMSAKDFRDTLLPLASNAVIVASLFLRNARRVGAPHFVAAAMVNETCAAAAASVWLAHRLVKRSSIAMPDVDEEVRKLLTDLDGVLGTNLGQTERPFGSHAVRTAVEDLLRVAAMVWHRFTLVRMSEFTTVRYVYFAFKINEIPADDEEVQRPLLAAIEPFIREQHFTGIAANLTLADCLSESSELSAIHLQLAAHLADETLFGEGLKNALALIAALNAHGMGGDSIRALIERILHAEAGQGSAVQVFLDHVPDDQLMGAGLRLANVAQATGDPSLFLEMSELLGQRAARVDSAAIRDDIDAMLDLFQTSVAIQKKAVDADAVLQRWTDRRHLWTYAALLRDLRTAGLGGTALRDDAMRLLERDPNLDHINSWYHLAIDVAQEVEGQTTAIDYVRDVVRRFEDIENAETNMIAYGLLFHRWPESGNYAQEAVRWQRVIIRRDNIQKLPHLVEQGKFFLIFVDNFEHMRVWGMPLDIPYSHLFEMRRQPSGKRDDWLRNWSARGGKVPEPFVMTPGAAVSSEFLILGDYLFDSPFDQEQRFDVARQRLNERARAGMPLLLQEVGTLARIPPEIRSLLEHYGRSHADPRNGNR